MGEIDEKFINGFEDVDLCRLVENGYRLTLNPESAVIHYADKSEGRHDEEARNAKLLATKNQDILRPNKDLLLEQDGLCLKMSKWFRLRELMHIQDLTRLNAQLSIVTTG